MQSLPQGIFPPIPTFFDAQDELDLATLERHIAWLMKSPLAGLLAMGSNGEAMHLSDAERVAVIRAARQAIDAHRRDGQSFILLAGAADFTTRGTITRCVAAADTGSDAVVILPPFAFPTQMSAMALQRHFTAVADASPIPVIIYNMPANTAGIDLSADLILKLAQHPNIIGMKDSSGQVVKLATVAAGVPAGFAVLAGSGSYIVPALSVGGTGAIAAVANVVPGAVARLFHLWQDRLTDPAQAAAREAEAHRLQSNLLAINAFVTTTHGVAGLKAALMATRGYGGIPRPPLLPLAEDLAMAVPAWVEKLA